MVNSKSWIVVGMCLSAVVILTLLLIFNPFDDEVEHENFIDHEGKNVEYIEFNHDLYCRL